jgi:hypothetical protein
MAIFRDFTAFPGHGRWYKGNLHCHSVLSDGTAEPDALARDYREQGYDFLALTDHNFVETHEALNRSDFLLVPGWERDIPYMPGNAKCIHVVGLCKKKLPPDAEKRAPRGDPATMSGQAMVDSMRNDDQFVILAHPAWSRMEPEEVRALSGFDAMEVYNNGTEVISHEGHASFYWDMLLREGRRIFVTACDDTHGKTEKSDRYGGWIWAKMTELSIPALMAALENGWFYSSGGPRITALGIRDGKAYVECSPCREIHVMTWPERGKAFFAGDAPLTRAERALGERVGYVRFECVDAKGRIAWSNPLYPETGDVCPR